MKRRINNRGVLIAILIAFPCIIVAQGSAPAWIDGDVRSMLYPQDVYYSAFIEIPLPRDEGQEEALNRAKQAAIGELSQRVRVMVNSSKTSADISVGGSDIEEQIRSTFSSIIKTTSQTEVTGSKMETWYDSKMHTVYAFAFASKAELSAYYQNQVSLWLNKVESALQTAGELFEKGYKMNARKQCESVIEAFAKVSCAQDLLTAIDEHIDSTALQQNRSERLRNILVQTISGLENSIYVYIECHETMNGEKVVHIADRLPGMITGQDCNCNFTRLQEEADYVIKVNARLTRCNDTPGDLVFCYANATASVYNVHTQKTLIPEIPESKGGWADKNRAKATEEAFNRLANKIAEKVIPLIKN